MTIKEAVSTLRLAFPRGEDLPPATIRLYEEHLADIGAALLTDTVREIIATAKFFPTIAEMRHTAASLAHLLPLSAEEALVIVQSADVREDIYRRDGSFAYTERYWRFPKEIPASTMQAIYAAFEQCGDMVTDNEARFGWETGFKAVYRTAAIERSSLALRDLSQAHLPLPLPDRMPPPVQLQIPGPRASLSTAEQELLARPDFKGLLLDLEEKVKNAEARRREQRETPRQEENTSPYLRAGHVRNLVSTHSPESQAVRDYWTPERTAARKALLHRQLAWIGRRDEAERAGAEFTETMPE